MKLLIRISAIVVTAFALYVIVGEQLVGSSGDAFINTRLVDVRAPREGTAQITVPPVGGRVQAGAVLASIARDTTDDVGLLQLEQAVAEAAADVAALRAVPSDGSDLDRERAALRADALQGLLEARRSAVATRAGVVVRSPTDGLVWSIRVPATGYVPAAEVLVSVADCASPFVHASVDQRLFNRLRVGDAAQFRFHGGETVDVTVAVLAGTGPRTLLETLAITPTERQLEGFAVLLSAPALASTGECPMGRTGRVVFSEGPLAFLSQTLSAAGF